ncbi:MAG: carboxylesterase/lipase family protein [Novosphingobium sp.]
METTSGALAGTAEDGIEAFLGVPYAAPPVGAWRWREPIVFRYSGRRDATRFGAACAQDVARPWGPYTQDFIASAPVSEDCLFLNVWKPAQAGQALPVVVYIHGGAFAGGSGHVPVYDGSNLARQGLVVVTINYRVGVFGFLAHPDMRGEGPGSGNFGLLDQIAALTWVRNNVARFGGDPARVTIMGESAGAASVNDLQIMPAAAGLFRNAVSISGASMAIDTPPLAAGEANGTALGERLGAKTLAELRAVPAARLIEVTRVVPGKGPPRLTWVPHVDGRILPADPAKPASPRARRVSLLTGFNGEEMIDPSVRTPAAFQSAVRGRYGAFAERILKLYPHATDAEAIASNAAVARDRYMAGLLLWAGARTRGPADPIYLYRHDQPLPRTAGGQDWGAFHSSSLPYIFGTVELGGRTATPLDRTISRRWQEAIASYARSGKPSVEGHAWPVHDGTSRDVMVFGPNQGFAAAVSTPQRFAMWRAFAKSGGVLGLM